MDNNLNLKVKIQYQIEKFDENNNLIEIITREEELSQEEFLKLIQDKEN